MNGDAVVAATGGEDPAGLAAAYDRYAAELYDYCRWLQPDQALVAGALRETFATLAASPPAPAGTGELCSCGAATHSRARRPRPPPVRDGVGAPAPGTPDPELAEARWLTRAALGELDPVEQEVIELRFRHHLTATES